MGRMYETSVGNVIISEKVCDGIVQHIGILMRDGVQIESTRQVMSTPYGTEETERAKRRLLVECIVERFQKKNSKPVSRNEEVAMGVIAIVNRRLREHVVRQRAM